LIENVRRREFICAMKQGVVRQQERIFAEINLLRKGKGKIEQGEGVGGVNGEQSSGSEGGRGNAECGRCMSCRSSVTI